MTSVAIADRTINVPFHGASLYVVTHGGEVYTPMRPIIDGMGLTYQGQVEKLKSRFAKGVREIMIPTKGGSQSMTCLALRKLNGWLQTISPNKVKPEIRDKVIQYQEECDDVLYEYFTKGEVVNPRMSRKSTTEERTPLRDAVNMLVSKRHLMYPEAYAMIHQRFQISSFEQLTPEQIAPAIEYVHKVILEGELLERQNEQLALPISYPMSYFKEFPYIKEINEHALSAPWRYPARLLEQTVDVPNPIHQILRDLKGLGYEVDAAIFQMKAIQHNLETMRRKIDTISRAIN